ncbi:hypothetical protein FISHEDRAFT_73931 [Fistulina hepatica ATCC 64428]|uniref:Uncharacterized protein n=1 Tax=Fistulina hepatica ATCC 64428 TaxID=1128425 RepID=A0A0D7AE22_9AGAR|nr:hypothetical protein FISHEDRAFT_73931 [Fistulina hepatica ATCC 64428]
MSQMYQISRASKFLEAHFNMSLLDLATEYEAFCVTLGDVPIQKEKVANAQAKHNHVWSQL